jgi:predicted aspartyl protease
MTRSAVWLLALALACAGGPIARAGEVGPIAGAEEGPVYAIPTSRDRIGRVLAPVMVDGKGPFRFMVDTGANRTALSPAAAQKLGLESRGGAPAQNPEQAIVYGVTGAATAPVVRINRLQADRLVWQNLSTPLVNGPVLNGADGILGADGFRDMRLTVNFRADRIELSPSRGWRAPMGYSVAKGALIKGALLTIPVQVGRVRATAVIDTGAERSIFNNALLQALAANEQPLPALGRTSVMGAVGGELPAVFYQTPELALGAATVKGLHVVGLDAPIFAVWDLDRTPALLIGMDVLGQTDVLVIDYRRAELWLRIPERATTGSRVGARSSPTRTVQ